MPGVMGRVAWGDGLRRLGPGGVFAVGGLVEFFGDLGQGGGVDLGPESVELLKAHDQGAPFVGVDVVRLPVHQDLFVEVNTDDL